MALVEIEYFPFPINKYYWEMSYRNYNLISYKEYKTPEKAAIGFTKWFNKHGEALRLKGYRIKSWD